LQISRTTIAGFGGALLVAGLIWTPDFASATEPTSPTHAEGSVVVPDGADVTIDDTHGGTSTRATQNVGGGTWNYGSELSGLQKKCYSNYMNRITNHGSTAIIGSSNRSASAITGKWSNATAFGGLTQTCKAYWRI
jgi:lactococcin 972 family bacteriocin